MSWLIYFSEFSKIALQKYTAPISVFWQIMFLVGFSTLFHAKLIILGARLVVTNAVVDEVKTSLNFFKPNFNRISKMYKQEN